MTFIIAVLELRLGFSARFTGMYGCSIGSFYLCVKKKKKKHGFGKRPKYIVLRANPVPRPPTSIYVQVSIILLSFYRVIYIKKKICIYLSPVSDRWHPAIFGEADRSRPKRKHAVRSSHVGYWHYRENGQNFRYPITGRY